VRRVRLASALALGLVACATQLGGGAVAARAQSPAPILAATPYMGWDTYFSLPGGYNEATILAEASLLKSSGLEADGYRIVWLDSGWWQGKRNAAGAMVASSTQWPHGIAWLASTLHANGFKLGLYTDAGMTGCGVDDGAYGHYQQDFNTFAAWGVDAVKVDWCGGSAQGLDPTQAYTAIHQAILDNASHRPMILDICNFLQPGQKGPGLPTFQRSAFYSYTFGPSAGNAWRTDTDVGSPGSVFFSSVLRNMDADATEPQAAGPGHWNDPDYLVPGAGMNAVQFQSQVSMWAILAAPLMIGADMRTINKTNIATLANKAVIAIDQDPAGVQGTLVPGAEVVSSSTNGEVWVKPMLNENFAVALLNRGSTTVSVSTTAAALGLPPASHYNVTNVWTNGKSTSTGSFGAQLAPYSTVLLRVSPA
jgi:alpha-galactosidase